MTYTNAAVCRVCESTEDLEMIFKKENEEIVSMLNSISFSVINSDDRLPPFICIQCILSLEETFLFKSLYERTYRKFKNMLIVHMPSKGHSRKNPAKPLGRSDVKHEKINDLEENSADIIQSYKNNWAVDIEKNSNSLSWISGKSESVQLNSDQRSAGLKGDFDSDGTVYTEDHYKREHMESDSGSLNQTSNKSCQEVVVKEEILLSDEFEDNELELQLHLEPSSKLSINEKGIPSASDDGEILNKKFDTNEQYAKLHLNAGIESGKSLIEYPDTKKYGAALSKMNKCEMCGKTFASPYILKTHLALHSSPDVYKCDICERTFTTASHLKIHKANHSSQESQKCEICWKTFSRADLLKRHRSRHSKISTSDKLHKCEQCGLSFSHASTLKTHLALHFNPSLYKCEKCGKSFAKSFYFKAHLSLHANPDIYKCEKCGKSCKSSALLKYHLNKNCESKGNSKCNICGNACCTCSAVKKYEPLDSNPDLYKCEECGKLLKLRSLIRHKALHSNPKLFKCDECGKSYSNAFTFRSHVALHSNPNLFKCEVCGKSFSRSFDLKAHQLLHAHPDLYKCKECGKCCSSSRRLKAHYMKHFDQQCFYNCQECGKSFREQSFLKQHEILHSHRDRFKCEVCGKTFARLFSLKAHQALHSNPDVYKCNECGKLFNSPYNFKKHVIMHSNPDLYRCKECGKPFSQATRLRKHLACNSKCKKCGKIYTCVGMLKEHKKAHSLSQALTCDERKNAYSEQVLLRPDQSLHLNFDA